MACPVCSGSTVVTAVPTSLREYVPSNAETETPGDSNRPSDAGDTGGVTGRENDEGPDSAGDSDRPDDNHHTTGSGNSPPPVERDRTAIEICADCLRVRPTIPTTSLDDPEHGELSSVSDAFPSGEAGVALVLLLDRLHSVARNRAAITELVEFVESHGGDPFLALDRLAREKPEAAIDLRRRRSQLEDLL